MLYVNSLTGKRICLGIKYRAKKKNIDSGMVLCSVLLSCLIPKFSSGFFLHLSNCISTFLGFEKIRRNGFFVKKAVLVSDLIRIPKNHVVRVCTI